MNKRQAQKEYTKKHILNVALELYAKTGISTTATSDIAVEAKVSHGTIFAHFPTKESLIDVVIEEFGEIVCNRLHEVVDHNCGMKELLEAHLQVLGEYEGLYSRLVSEAPILHASARNTLIGVQSAISFHLSQIAEKEMNENKLLRMPVHLMFNTWIGLIHYYLINKELFAPDESVIFRYGNELIEHYMKMVSLR